MAEYTPIGQGIYNTVAGSVGLASALTSGNILGGLFGGNATNNYVSKESFDLSMQLAAAQRDNSILSAELNTEKKVVEAFTASNDKLMLVRDELNKRIYDLEKKVDDGFASQAVINCGFNSSIAVLQSQAAQFMGMTKTVIPITNVCPTPAVATTTA